MNEQVFWKIIEDSKVAFINTEVQIGQVYEVVETLIVPRIYKYHKLYLKVMQQANQAELWVAAYILNAGCDEEEFKLFRCWLILQGQKVFKQAIEDPETLTDYAYNFKEEKELLYRCENFLNVALKIFNARYEHVDFWNEYPYDIEESTLQGDLPTGENAMIDAMPLLCRGMGWGNEIPKGHWVSDTSVPMGQK